MNFVRKLIGDFLGLSRVLGITSALRWLLHIVGNLSAVVRHRNLQPADKAMGEGPFDVHFRNGVQFSVMGQDAVSGIREMYVRDTYLRNGLLTIEDGDVVVDLGANMGNFTNLALAHGGSVRVVSVEPGANLNKAYTRSVGLNDGFLTRTQLIRAFIGKRGEKQERLLDDEQYRGAEWTSEDELIAKADLSRIDFLKCDIEGGEFELLRPGSRLLDMARKLAVEIHHFAGNVNGFMDMLVEQGFKLKFVQRDPDGTATVLAIRS